MNLLEHLSTKKIQYNDNKGYRQCLRVLFDMNPETYAEKIDLLKTQEILDEETEDEISYDEIAASTILDKITEQTKGSYLMDNVYKIAASKMMSDDVSIGLAVLFSYDYLSFFHLCLVDYLRTPNDFSKENINYINLVKKIS